MLYEEENKELIKFGKALTKRLTDRLRSYYAKNIDIYYNDKGQIVSYFTADNKYYKAVVNVIYEVEEIKEIKKQEYRKMKESEETKRVPDYILYI